MPETERHSNLTAEQQQRIQANREKAIARRKELAALKVTSNQELTSFSSDDHCVQDSSLTEEQRQRIQANRDKAIARRKELAALKVNSNQEKTGFLLNNHCIQNVNLTEEQRQKIHANREKAIARRKELSVLNVASNQKLTNASLKPHSIQNTDAIPQFEVRSEKIITALKEKPTRKINSADGILNNCSASCSSFQEIQTNRNCNLETFSKTNSFENNCHDEATKVHNSNKSHPIPIDNSSKQKALFNHKSSKILSGVCSLISKTRFSIQIGYHQQLQEIVKAIPSSSYDFKTKTWSLHINDHDLLFQLIQPLHPDVVIGRIPTFVHQLLKTSEEQVDISSLNFITSTVHSALLPFQVEGVRFGIANGGRVLIADDMGLGKTIQAIALADYYSAEWPVLCVVPSSVRYSWVQAFENWLPHIKTKDIYVLNSSKDKVGKTAKVVILSYDLLSKCYKLLIENHNFQVIIMDESHFLKNVKSARTKAAREVVKDCKRLILLSGTPALSRPAELYPQLNMLNKKVFNNFTQFGIRYCNGKKVPWGNGWDFKGSSNMKELQILLTKDIMIRRLKSNVMSQLPAKQRSMIILDPLLVNKRTKLMEKAEKNMHLKSLKGTEKHGALLQYFSESASAKLTAVSKYIEDLVESDRKFLCFAHHKIMLNNICDLLTEKKIKHIRIDGHTSSGKRKELCDAFQNDNYKVAVLSITAANAGITLTAASLVIFAELFWNPGILTQAEDRVHRIGQDDMVSIHYLVAKGTADDFLWPLVQQKLDVLNKAGLSKDNFSDAATKVSEESSTQSSILDFLNEIDNDLLNDLEEDGNCAKRQKMS